MDIGSHVLVAIKDAKSRRWYPPTTYTSVDEARRAFGVLVTDQQSKGLPALYPADFDLWFLGVFDDATGKLAADAAPEHLCNGQDFARS